MTNVRNVATREAFESFFSRSTKMEPLNQANKDGNLLN